MAACVPRLNAVAGLDHASHRRNIHLLFEVAGWLFVEPGPTGVYRELTDDGANELVCERFAFAPRLWERAGINRLTAELRHRADSALTASGHVLGHTAGPAIARRAHVRHSEIGRHVGRLGQNGDRRRTHPKTHTHTNTSTQT